MSRDQTSAERAPLCPICGTRHWGREPHVLAKKKEPTGTARAPQFGRRAKPKRKEPKK